MYEVPFNSEAESISKSILMPKAFGPQASRQASSRFGGHWALCVRALGGREHIAYAV